MMNKSDASRAPLVVLHVDDNIFELDTVTSALTEDVVGPHRFQVLGAASTQEAWDQVARFTPDIAIIDIKLSETGEEGIELISKLKESFPDLVVIMRSSSDDARTVQRSVVLGADDFISKKVTEAELSFRVSSAYTMAWLKRGGRGATSISKRPVVGATIQRIAQEIPRVLRSAVSALHVVGESGVGKEVVADLIESEVRGLPFVRVNCGGISPSLLESELFGHAKGAFTGATTEKKGFIEEASGGWLFLDEVACLSMSAQVALLRVLENQEVVRVGETKPRKIRVKIVSACNERLDKLVEGGKFRRDLWQRLCEKEIEIPPLRERPLEIPSLVEHFCGTMEGGPYTVTPEALDVLRAYPWKDGNVRELRNCLRAMTSLHVNRVLSLPSIPERLWKNFAQIQQKEAQEADQQTTAGPTASLQTESGPQSALRALDIPADLGPSVPAPFDKMCLRLFVLVVRCFLGTQSKPSVHSLSKTLCLSPHTVSKRLQEALDEGIATQEEMSRILG